MRHDLSPRLSAVLLTSAVLLLSGLSTPTPADARPRARVGVWVGGPMWWPGFWGYPMVVERPVVVLPPAEPLVVQPSAAQQAPVWYYCHEAQMYYPHVTACPSPWQEVAATPAPAAPVEAPAAPYRSAPAPVPAAPR